MFAINICLQFTGYKLPGMHPSLQVSYRIQCTPKASYSKNRTALRLVFAWHRVKNPFSHSRPCHNGSHATLTLLKFNRVPALSWTNTALVCSIRRVGFRFSRILTNILPIGNQHYCYWQSGCQRIIGRQTAPLANHSAKHQFVLSQHLVPAGCVGVVAACWG